jgi:hypothetical protein
LAGNKPTTTTREARCRPQPPFLTESVLREEGRSLVVSCRDELRCLRVLYGLATRLLTTQTEIDERGVQARLPQRAVGAMPGGEVDRQAVGRLRCSLICRSTRCKPIIRAEDHPGQRRCFTQFLLDDDMKEVLLFSCYLDSI